MFSVSISSKKPFLTALAAAVICAGTVAKAEGATINIYPGDGFSGAQAKIETANSGDEVIFNPGSYSLNYLQQYSLKPGTEGSHIRYILDNADMAGSGPEHDSIFVITSGGYIDIEGNLTSTLGNALAPISIGVVSFKSINIRGVNFENVYDHSVGYQNRKHSSPLEEPAINVSYCIADGGHKFIKFGGGTVNENSPWAGVSKCTVSNMSAPTGAIDMPSFYVEPLAAADVGWVILGKDDMNANVFENSYAPWNPDDYNDMGSPTHNRYMDVNEMFIGEPNDDNQEVDANDFYDDTLYPVMFGGVHLADGNSAGGLPFVATIESLRYFAECYLSDSNSPEYDQRADFNRDLIINLIDFGCLADRWYNTEIGPISKAIPVLEESY